MHCAAVARLADWIIASMSRYTGIPINVTWRNRHSHAVGSKSKIQPPPSSSVCSTQQPCVVWIKSILVKEAEHLFFRSLSLSLCPQSSFPDPHSWNDYNPRFYTRVWLLAGQWHALLPICTVLHDFLYKRDCVWASWEPGDTLPYRSPNSCVQFVGYKRVVGPTLWGPKNAGKWAHVLHIVIAWSLS